MSDKKNKLKRSRISSEESNTSSLSSSATSSSDEETDAKDLKPIKEYLSNRKELASQLFKSVKAEKIRMMLPQILKKVEFNDLEELCANELIGMSKRRIMSIINGQEMLQSSNTEDSDDDLDPPLEIISDTEWLSSEEANLKADNLNSKNKDIKKSKKKCQDLKKSEFESKLKCKGKGKLNIKVKTEIKEKDKQKEGESLLDLLELEMRARAIRALIRKEEDSTNPKDPKINDSTNTISESGISNDKNTKVRQENLKEHLQKIDVLMKHGEDEDVFVVIQPAPTIELISSESDTDDHSKRINQKLVNERTSQSKKIQEEETKKCKDKDTNEKDKGSDKNTNVDKDKNEEKNKVENTKEKENRNENSNSLINTAESNVHNKVENLNQVSKEVDLEEGEIIDDNETDKMSNKEIEVNIESPSNRKIKKIKRNPFIRSRKKIKENKDANIECSKVEISVKAGSKTENEKNINNNEKKATELIEVEQSSKIQNNTDETVKLKESESDINSKIDLFDDKSLDIDEVINLDDYPDDMDDLEKSEVNKEKKGTNKTISSINKDVDKDTISNAPARSETWATRYYKQDDVQNVIKESKIQSEIRKRLRERQRQSKMSNSPKLKDQEILQQCSEPIIPKPTGSVEEYLALKGFSSETNTSTPEIAGSSKLLKQNDSSIGDKDPTSEKNEPSTSESKIETKSDSLTSDNKTIEQSITIVKKPKLVTDIVVNKTDSTLNENIAVKQLSKVFKCDNPLTNCSETYLEQKLLSSNVKSTIINDNSYWNNQHVGEHMKENLSEIREQNELNKLRNTTYSSRIDDTSLKCDLSNDKSFVKIDDAVLSDQKLDQE